MYELGHDRFHPTYARRYDSAMEYLQWLGSEAIRGIEGRAWGVWVVEKVRVAL